MDELDGVIAAPGIHALALAQPESGGRCEDP